MEKEFGYKSEKSSNSDKYGSGNIHTITSRTTPTGSVREKGFIGPFSEISNSTPVRSYENTNETIGKYKSRNNIGYDDSDNSLNREPATGFSPLNRSNFPKIDHDEYWRTNI